MGCGVATADEEQAECGLEGGAGEDTKSLLATER